MTKLGIYSFNLKHTNNEKIVKKHFYKDPFKQNILKLLKSKARSLRWVGMTTATTRKDKINIIYLNFLLYLLEDFNV